MRSRLAKMAAVGAAVTMGFIGIQADIASAGPGACRTEDTGCLRWYKSGTKPDEYRFGSSDTNLGNNWFVTESCNFAGGPKCVEDLRVAGHIGAMRLNSTKYLRMCVYANTGYGQAIYWITKRGAMYTTGGSAGQSLYYNTKNSCS